MWLNLAYQVLDTKVGSLYLEVPEITESLPAGNSFYVTPGMRLKIPTGTRFSFYTSLGGGFGKFHSVETISGGQLVSTYANTYRPVFDFAAGVDFRVAHWFSLRAEARDNVAPHGLSGVLGHNHPLLLYGFAFHN